MDVQLLQKITCTRVEFGPSKIDGHSMVTVNTPFFPMHKICTKLSSFLNLQDMCNIINENLFELSRVIQV